MTRELIKIKTEAQWLDLRRDDITSTMVPALFGLSPYTTKFELYHAKASGVEVPFKSNNRVEAGNRMEQYAAQEVAEATGWKVEPFKDYMRIPGERMGSSFDCEATKPDGSKGILEIKAVDFFIHKDRWVDDQAPEHIEIQLQHQLECADRYEWGAIAAFTGIYDFHMYERDRDRDFGKALRQAVAAFWDDVENKREPEPDFARDLDIITLLHKGADGEKLDKTDDADFELLVSRFDRWSATKKEAEKEVEKAKAEIHHTLQGATGAFTDKYRVTAGYTKDNPGRVADPGEIIGARQGYRQCLIKTLNKPAT